MFQANQTFADIASFSQFAFDIATYAVEIENITQFLAVSINKMSDFIFLTFIKNPL